MGAFFSLLLGKIAAIVKWFGDLAVAVFESLWDLFKDGVCWTFESLLKVAVSAMGSVDVSAFDQYSNVWSSLPASVLQALGVLRVAEASAIIIAAIGVRLVLQLIPFTRLGS